MQCTITLSNRTLYIKVLQKVSVKAKGEKRVSTFHKKVMDYAIFTKLLVLILVFNLFFFLFYIFLHIYGRVLSFYRNTADIRVNS